MNKKYFGGFVGLACVALLGGCGSDLVVGSGNAGGQGNEAGAGGESGAGDAGEGGASGAASGAAEETTHANKLDVLFVVDSSTTMSGKQGILEASLPSFIERLVNPRCVDAEGVPVDEQPANGAEPCAAGTREHPPLSDLHFGVISTSLGAHGGTICATPNSAESTFDDRAELLGKVRDGVPSYQGQGYASFDASGTTGDADLSAVVTQLQAMVSSAGEHGCGYEAPLEAMYRFLIDPEPPLEVKGTAGKIGPVGVNEALLSERAAFLRPDSAVAIVMLGDENDCSLIDDATGAFFASNQRLPRSTQACDSNPNDVCCRSCATTETQPPDGCSSLADDAICGGNLPNTFNTWDALHDSLTLRCFDQKRRFGFDALQPLERYTRGLTELRVPARDGSLVANPLLAARDGFGPRSPSLIKLTAIVGVPWQDLATKTSFDSTQALEYLSPSELAAEGRWPLLLGEPAKNTPPLDPFMRESIEPRSGKNPLTGTPTVSESSHDPQANPINGHEQASADLSDLQYACTFELSKPRACENGDANCHCSADKNGDTTAVDASNSPLCQPPGGGPASTTEYYGNAYPGTRQLALVQALGANAGAASMCPKTLAEKAPDFGYVPAFDALLRGLAPTFR